MKKHHRIVPVALVTLAIPIALFGAFLLLANIFTHDEAPPDDSMLRLPNVTVADADNAYFDVQKMDAAVTAVDPNAIQTYTDTKADGMLNGGDWDEAYANELITKHIAAISIFHTAAAKSHYQDPAAAHPGSWTVKDLPTTTSTIRFIGRLVALEGLRKAKNGDVAGGLAEAIEVVKLGHMMETEQNTLINWLVGGSVKQMGLSSLRQIGLQTKLTASQSKDISQQLELYRDSRDGLEKTAKFEYAGASGYRAQTQHLDTLMAGYNITTDALTGATIVSSGPWWLAALDLSGLTRFYYWPNQSWRFTIERTEKLVAATQTNCATGDLNPPIKYFNERNFFLWLFESNAIGKVLSDISQISNSGIAVRLCGEQLSMSATEIVLASRAYQHDNGKLPASLEALVPNYLTAVPVDPYSGQALRYAADKKIVYSVGPNRIDDGGNMTINDDPYLKISNLGDWPNMLDPTFLSVDNP